MLGIRPILVALMLVGCLPGCATWNQRSRPAANLRLQARNEGYSLLHDVLSKQKDVTKILLVKREEEDVRELVIEIARTAADATKQLEEFAQEDPDLNLKLKTLSWSEQKTRNAIESTQSRQLLLSSGRKLELRVLLAQVEALNYASHLARVVRDQEENLKRKIFLENLSRKMEELYQKVFNLLSARMQAR